MDLLPGTYYWKGLILMRDRMRRPRARLGPQEKPAPLRPPIEPLEHPASLAQLGQRLARFRLSRATLRPMGRTAAEREQFTKLGYFIRPGFLDAARR